MKICNILKSNDKAIVWCESSRWRSIADLKTNEVSEISTLNTVILNDGTMKALGDDEIEIIGEIDDD